jgi:hypothetical protein
LRKENTKLEKKTVSGIMLTLLLASNLMFAFGVINSTSLLILWQKDVHDADHGDVGVADIGGDGFYDVIVAETGFGFVLAFDGYGNLLWNFSVIEENCAETLFIGDVNNDNLDDIVVYASNVWARAIGGVYGEDAYLYVIDNFGSLMWKQVLSGWVAGSDRQVVSMGDIDGDGKTEIVSVGPKEIIVFDQSGSEVWRFYVGSHIGNVKVGDVDGDEIMDVIVTYWTSSDSGGVIALDGSGSLLWNYPISAGMKALGIGDVNGDGRNEIVATSYYSAGADGIYLINGQGTLIWYKPFADETHRIAIGDIDSDGINDIVAVTGNWDGGRVYVINGYGSLLWSYNIGSTPISNVAIGDFDGNGRRNDVALCGAWYAWGGAVYQGVWVLNGTGVIVGEFVGEKNFVSLATGDINDDRVDDIVTLSLENKIYALTSKILPPPVVTATVDIDPDTLNLKSKGQWITSYIELPGGYNVSDIDIYSIRLNDTFPVSLLPYPPVPGPMEIGDYDSDGIPDLMVKFNRTALTSYIYDVLGIKYGDVTLTISGNLTDGTLFEGIDTIKVIFVGDINDDGSIDSTDLGIFGVAWSNNPYNPDCDFNSDGVIDSTDYGLLATNYGATIP